MKCKAETPKEFSNIFESLKDGDAIVVSTVKIMGRNKDEALNNYVELFNRGVYIYPIKETYLRPITVLNLLKETRTL